MESVYMIRWKVFLSALILTLLVLWIAVFRLESWVRAGIESGISAITNTKTEIKVLSISFKNSSLKIKGLAIASPRAEFKNILEISEISIDFQSLPLLEKRFVVDDFSIEGISWATDRKTSGWLPKKMKSKESSWISKQVDETFSKVSKEFKDLPVNQLADFRIPNNPKEILSLVDLKSEEVFRSSIAKIQEAISDWKKKLQQIQDVSEYQSFVRKLDQLTANLPKDPKVIVERIKLANEVVKFFQSEVKKTQKFIEDVQEEQKRVLDIYSEANQAIRADYERAQKLVSLDQLNVDNLSRLIFGAYWVNEAQRILSYQAFLRQKLDLKFDEKRNVEVQQRASGRDIIFVTPQKKPSFVLAKSDLSVTGLEKTQDNKLSQTYELKIRDVNSNPKLYAKPTSIDLTGRFRSAPIGSFQLELFWDYTKQISKDRYQLKVDKIEASNWPMGVPGIFPLKIEKGMAESSSQLNFEGDEMNWKNRIHFSEVVWDFKEVPRMGFILPVLIEAFDGIKNFYLDIQISKNAAGEISYRVISDADNQLMRAVQSAVAERLNEFLSKMKSEIELQVTKYRGEAENQLKQFNQEIFEKAQSKLQMTKKYQNQAQAKLKSL
ncbi:MAG: TIGR03545 family protein, partial [Bdellovibrionota bacterium]